MGRYKKRISRIVTIAMLFTFLVGNSNMIWMRLEIKGRKSWFKWSLDGDTYKEIGPCFDTTKFSDEYSEFGEFTGTFVGITCGDRMLHQHTADFDFFEYVADETADVK